MPAASQRADLVKKLVEEGFLVKSRRGRPTIYQSDQECNAALQAQRKACSQRYAERLRNAVQTLKTASLEQSRDE